MPEKKKDQKQKDDKNEGAVVAPEGGAVQVTDEDVDAFLQEGVGQDLGPELAPTWPQIRLLHDAQCYEIPGEEAPQKSFVGQIVHVEARRAWWEKKVSEGGGNRPDCHSIGNLRPSPSSPKPQSDLCADCARAQFGSAKEGAGQDCRDMRWIFVLFEGHEIPYFLVLPATSLKEWSSFITLVADSPAKRPHGVMTRFGVKEAQNQKGTKYARATFSIEEQLDREALKRAIKMDRSIAAISAQMEPDMGTAGTGGASGSPQPPPVDEQDVPF